MFTKAIVKFPCRNMVAGLSSAELGQPDYNLALKQHKEYISALEYCGLEVHILEADENYPDSCFIEDIALLTPHCAIITNPGANTRKGEIIGIKAQLEKFYTNIEQIEDPGTIEAGDIMMTGSHYYIGLSERTNKQGAEQMIYILDKYGMSGSIVKLKEVLHLKTGLAYLENNNLLASGEFLNKKEFQKFNIIEIDKSEAYAANCIWVNDHVIIPAGYPGTNQQIKDAGYKTIEVDVSEFRKLDGGLSCLSLRF